jgi:hypothetical protein
MASDWDWCSNGAGKTTLLRVRQRLSTHIRMATINGRISALTDLTLGMDFSIRLRKRDPSWRAHGPDAEAGERPAARHHGIYRPWGIFGSAGANLLDRNVVCLPFAVATSVVPDILIMDDD